MIISHKHRFIFIRAQKTASTSLQINLARQCGPDDIITDIKLEKRRLSQHNPDFAKIQAHRPRNADGIRAHIFPEDIIARFGKEIWEKYFKIVVVRNPWDQACSEYDFSKTVKLQREFGYGATFSWRYYFIGEEAFGLKNGTYLRFEDLAAEYQRLCGTLGISHEPLPHCKANKRNGDYHLTEEMKEIVAIRAKRIIDFFGYRVPEVGVEPTRPKGQGILNP